MPSKNTPPSPRECHVPPGLFHMAYDAIPLLPDHVVLDLTIPAAYCRDLSASHCFPRQTTRHSQCFFFACPPLGTSFPLRQSITRMTSQRATKRWRPLAAAMAPTLIGARTTACTMATGSPASLSILTAVCPLKQTLNPGCNHTQAQKATGMPQTRRSEPFHTSIIPVHAETP